MSSTNDTNSSTAKVTTIDVAEDLRRASQHTKESDAKKRRLIVGGTCLVLTIILIVVVVALSVSSSNNSNNGNSQDSNTDDDTTDDTDDSGDSDDSGDDTTDDTTDDTPVTIVSPNLNITFSLDNDDTSITIDGIIEVNFDNGTFGNGDITITRAINQSLNSSFNVLFDEATLMHSTFAVGNESIGTNPIMIAVDSEGSNFDAYFSNQTIDSIKLYLDYFSDGDRLIDSMNDYDGSNYAFDSYSDILYNNTNYTTFYALQYSEYTPTLFMLCQDYGTTYDDDKNDSITYPTTTTASIWKNTSTNGTYNETTTVFVLLESTYNSSDLSVTGYDVPAVCFDNFDDYTRDFNDDLDSDINDGLNGVFTVGLTPKGLVNGTAIDTGTNRRSLQDDACNDEDRCQAASILCPVEKGCTVTSSFGFRYHPIKAKRKMHWGVDYRAAVGDTLIAAAAGTVERSYTSTSYGETIVIRHNDGSATLYAHLSKRDVKGGDIVSAGQTIGKAGNTGRSTGPHLHFEYVPSGVIFKSKTRIDPHKCIGNEVSGSIELYDSSSTDDDGFEIFVDGVSMGRTEVGGTGSVISVNNILPGKHKLKIVVWEFGGTVANYVARLDDDWEYDDGTTIKAGILDLASNSVAFTFIVPEC